MTNIKLIAHRGNITGPNQKDENNPSYVSNCLNKGYDAEIDVWYIDGKFVLGHDAPQYDIHPIFLSHPNLWIHAKNVEALSKLKNITNCFFHDSDDCVLTSKNYIWVYPGKKLTPNCVCVSPEKGGYSVTDMLQCHAICTDYVTKYHDLISG